jgi:hypothetical protein
VSQAKLTDKLADGARRRYITWKFNDWALHALILLILATATTVVWSARKLLLESAGLAKQEATIIENAAQIAGLQQANANSENRARRWELKYLELLKKIDTREFTQVPALRIERGVVEKRVLGSSGLGRNFGATYPVCSDTLSPDQRIVDHHFRLEGDRACGSWSSCTLIKSSPKEVCYAFSLQGHDEWFPPRTADSAGILAVTVETTTSQ